MVKFNIPKKNVFRLGKCKLCGVLKWDITSNKNRNKREKYYFDDYFKCWRFILWAIKNMHTTMILKSVTNYLKGVLPNGCGKHDKTGNVFHVFCMNSRYLKVLNDIRFLIDNYSDSSKDKTFFVVIESEEVHKIMNVDSRLDKFSILRYFMCMLSTVNYNATYFDVMGKEYNNFVGFMEMII